MGGPAHPAGPVIESLNAERRLVLVRHAQSEWNAVGRWQGQADPPLSSEGRRQAQALADALKGEAIDLVVSSDLRRALETARIVGASLGLSPVPDARFRELDVGDWTGLVREQIERRAADALARFDAGDPDLHAGGAESRREIRRRVRRAAEALVREHSGHRIALVTHLGVIRALLPGTELGNAEWCRVRVGDLESARGAHTR
jgi:probable phosphoglycerate mutase